VAVGDEAALRALLAQLRAYRVLDPACGSGNFLYIAYREMKRLEHDLLELLHETGSADDGFVSAAQFYGLDINPFAVELAKVTLMVGKKLAVDELHTPELPLPLDNLDDNIRVGDALFEPWPAFDACIGNPPYLGAKRMKVEHSPDYINRVRAAFPDVPGNADYCVYWFRKAHEVMQDGARTGLVGTNTIRQNYSRIGGLDYIADNGGTIYEAVSTLPWSGEAAVHVSIACWSKGAPPYTPALLWINDGVDSVEVPTISSSLSLQTDVSDAAALECNREPKRVFIGQQTGHEAFLLSSDDTRDLIQGDRESRSVIFPFLIGRDLTSVSNAQPSRYVIDMNDKEITEAGRYRAAYRRLEAELLPFRKTKAEQEQKRNQTLRTLNPSAKINHHHSGFLRQWWKHAWGRPDMIGEIKKRSRFVVCSEVTKRPIFDFVSSSIRPDHTLIVFTYDDDYTFGILQSNVHWLWFTEKASTLKSDYRYTPHSVFDTFPFPQAPTPAQVKRVADAARALHEWRRVEMRKNDRITLRSLYRSLELPGKNPLKDLHTALDAAVIAAYGFAAGGDALAGLLALNRDVAARIGRGESVTAPGVPADYPNPAELVSDGCIQPPALEN
jgi:SAM-dependent methyltransferase